MKNFFILSAVAFSVACMDTVKDTGEDPADTATEDSGAEEEDTAEEDTGETEPAEVEALVEWDDDGATITLFNSDPTAQYFFGVAQTYDETDNTVAQEAPNWYWTREDCDLGFGTDVICHQVPLGTESLRLDAECDYNLVKSTTDGTETGDPQITYLTANGFTAAPDDCSPGATDLTSSYTYILDAGTMCWVWGSAIGYYDSFDCEAVAW